MSCTQTGKVLPARITSETIAASVAGVLRREHHKSGSALKSIQRVTGASYDSACKWHRARNAPKSASLLRLAAHYPQILRVILELIGRSDVWNLCLQHAIPQKMLTELPRKTSLSSAYDDTFVVLNVLVDLQTGCQLNQRQLWFLGKLQQGGRAWAQDLCSVWQVNHRTAQRDIAGLVQANLIRFTGAKKNGRYVVF
ncbi:MAG TPA: hypothetical protein VFT64_05835 [Rickettsiales bacterium]|nr:hypothetical protein [Rickettsiales bacterium]